MERIDRDFIAFGLEILEDLALLKPIPTHCCARLQLTTNMLKTMDEGVLFLLIGAL